LVHASIPAERAGYAGTAIYSRLPFVSVQNGLGFELADSQGRFITAEFDLGLSHPVHIASYTYHQVQAVMKHKHVKIYFFKNTPKYSNNGEMKINRSSCVVTTISCISVLILKTGQAIRNHLAVCHMNVHGLTIFMMNLAM
jgi:exonuclease III